MSDHTTSRMHNLRERDYNYEPIGENQDVFNDNENEVAFRISGYQRNGVRSFFFHLFAVILLGIPYILLEFYPSWKTLKWKKCTLDMATKVLISDCYSKYFFSSIQTETVTLPDLGLMHVRFFFFQHTKYIWLDNGQKFAKLDEIITHKTFDDFLNDKQGIGYELYNELLKFYGQNRMQIEIKSYLKLFREEVFNPFYFFQIFSVTLWCFDDYMLYAGCVAFLTLFSSFTSLQQTRKDSVELHNLVESSKCSQVTVRRFDKSSNEITTEIDPVELVPGDLIILPPSNFNMPCDAVILTGQVIVNESVLTGESIPITKTALYSATEIYSSETHKRHTLFAGTFIEQTRYYEGADVLARVVRTGFDTTKGTLVKSILYQNPIDLKFYKDTFLFVAVLFAIAASGMAYCIHMYLERKAPMKDLIIRTLDIITIVVPPALPAAMATGTLLSQNRLKKKKLFCRSPPRINTCGQIKLACFDKTGTLTHDCLDMKSVIPCFGATFGHPVTDITTLDVKSKFVQAMATCHSLTTISGELKGDPLDLNMFEFTKWFLCEPQQTENARYDQLYAMYVTPDKNDQEINFSEAEFPYQIAVLHQFAFSSTLQRMSVICQQLGAHQMTLFTKGAPEKVVEMCLPETVPSNFSQLLSNYTIQGYRVIAVAYKDLKKFNILKVEKTKRDVIECNLIFLGLIIMQNPLKDNTAPVLKVLHNANIRTAMITGDNILTAISVARDCDMVSRFERIYVLTTENHNDSNIIPKLLIEEASSVNDGSNTIINLDSTDCHLAIEGRTWNKLKQYYSEQIPSIIVRCTIFARFQPDQKTELIRHFQKIDYVVSMVGDGANDCGALKAAHVGVSLSQSETSIAAPFTSSIEDISCIIHLMLEGRCALVTSFAIFKYMALYSLIQFFTILILYKHHSILGDYQFLFIDLIMTSALALTLGVQGPSKRLTVQKPMSSLVAVRNIIPIFLQILTCGLIQIGALVYLFQQNWFKPIPTNVSEEVVLSWENTVVFTVSCYQYVVLALVYSKGRPFRRSLITNVWFILVAVILTAFITWMMVHPVKKLSDIIEIMYLHNHFGFRLHLLAFPALHLILAVLIEVIGDSVWFKRFVHFCKCKRQSKSKYKRLLQEEFNLI